MSSPPRKRSAFRPVLTLAILSFLVCGFLFPLVVTGIAQVALPNQANGSLVQVGCRTVGSYYIDNGFSLPIFFHARNESNPLTFSASGVDPDITLQDALGQTLRISSATGISSTELASIVQSHGQNTLWMFGYTYVNVVSLNAALIDQFGNQSGSPYAPYQHCIIG